MSGRYAYEDKITSEATVQTLLATDNPGDEDPQRVKYTWSFNKRLGSKFRLKLISALIVLAAPTCFLAFMWFSDRSNEHWRGIMLANFSGRAVTLSSVAVRIVVTLLTGYATRMIASIAAESRGVPLESAALISTARALPMNPLHLLKHLKIFSGSWLSLLVIMLSLSTIATQFASTLLVSDLGQELVVAFPNESTISSGLSLFAEGQIDPTSPLFFNPSYWTHSPTAYERFAEYSEPASFANGIDDTGVTLRSFLPISSQSKREHLSNFNGTASLFDFRVVCVRPNILDLEICSTDPPQLCGNITINSTVPNLVAPSSPVSFRSQLSADSLKGTYNETSSAWLLNFLGVEAGGLIPILDATNNASLRHRWNAKIKKQRPSVKLSRSGSWQAESGSLSWLVDVGQAYLIFNLTEPPVHRKNVSSVKLMWNSWPGTGTFTHVKYSLSTGEVDYFRMSVCYDSLPIPSSGGTVQEFQLETHSLQPASEPTVTRDPNAAGLDTRAIRNQLGAWGNKTLPQERGLWDLTSKKQIDENIFRRRDRWSIPEELTATIDLNATTYPYVIPIVLDQLQSIALCFKCSHDNIRQASGVLISLFNDILVDTGSPALALQAVLTVTLRMAYFDWTQSFNAPSNISTISFQEAIVPIRKIGFLIVVSIMIFHLLACLCILVAFGIFARRTMIGNYWHVTAQLANCPEAIPILRHAQLRTDKEVRRFIVDSNLVKHRFKITEKGI